ncbi:hypothetical protein GUITHDRAFT_146353 [Guillardia theta CCMP2712]|uniref:Disintegrin domain-containing protein n=1 Tax=Guillardia theta (strain CCMP2712) TaxID=905079 RepID=L1IHN7_GUITC|nr:hypothetical protein GUITHDRAFT_146353 [Guillardia theta CCMP2712]EKX35617.1 hypothetical protein GUITHDRAFT_146353 [Guillardia theta CCMP2712]|eukprot:XP_005822597.1 hypothetical protein GUITHDRAFT_146353 [Guillardia theta CCMP2712]
MSSVSTCSTMLLLSFGVLLLSASAAVTVSDVDSRRAGGDMNGGDSKPPPSREDKSQGMQDSQQYMASRDMCPPSSTMCPSFDAVLADKKGQCVKTMALCFNETMMSVNLTALNMRCTLKNDQYCIAQGSCSRGLPCAPAAVACNASSYRCADWSCAASQQDCPTSSLGANEVLCSDGITKKSNLQGCAKAGITWEGCPPQSTACSSNPNYCKSSTESCEVLTGCSDGLLSCGLKRDSDGKVIMNTTSKRPQFVCSQTCDRPPTPEPRTAMLMPGTGNQEIRLNSSDGKMAFALHASSQNAFRRTDNKSDAVNFTISPVPSSALQEGPFAQYFKAGKIVSDVITIEPSVDLTIEGGLMLDIPLLGTAESCQGMLKHLELVVVSDLLNFSSSPERVGNCSKGAIGNCSCLSSIFHFSTYAVADAEVPANSDTPAPPPPTNSPAPPSDSPVAPAPVAPPATPSGTSTLSGLSGLKLLAVSLLLSFVALI